MNNFFELITLIILGGVSILAFFAALILLLPSPINKIRGTLEESGGRSLLLGFINFIFFGLIVVLCIDFGDRVGGVLAGILSVLGSLIALVLSALSVLGLVGLAQLLGERIGKDASLFVIISRGGGLLLLAGLAPFIGWFLFTPLAVWAGLGASIQVFVRRKKAPELDE